MHGLNCRLGDLAVTVKAAIPENLGNMVRVVGFLGDQKWHGFKEPTPIWEVEVVEGSRLVYQYDGGERFYATQGHIPDAFLKPIAPRRQGKEVEMEADLTCQAI